MPGAAGGWHWPRQLRRAALQSLQGGVEPGLPLPQALLLRVRILQDQRRCNILYSFLCISTHWSVADLPFSLSMKLYFIPDGQVLLTNPHKSDFQTGSLDFSETATVLATESHYLSRHYNKKKKEGRLSEHPLESWDQN